MSPGQKSRSSSRLNILILFIPKQKKANEAAKQVDDNQKQILPSAKKKRVIQQQPLRPPFDWSEHLAKTNATVAPADCFCQRQIADAPTNFFKIGHKLETNDPRNKASLCIASVIEVQGSRLRLRLDGSDDRNDFWLMCDSDQIHPFEYSTRKGLKIQPPMGFVKDLSRWPKFLENIIQSAEEGQCTFAPESTFREAPVAPPTNKFCAGQKLEAVDPRNPRFIYPATITATNGTQVQVSFDGWGQFGQFWCSYTSRDLFPVGWCQATCHWLQHPGSLVDKPPLEEKSNHASKGVMASAADLASTSKIRVNTTSPVVDFNNNEIGDVASVPSVRHSLTSSQSFPCAKKPVKSI